MKLFTHLLVAVLACGLARASAALPPCDSCPAPSFAGGRAYRSGIVLPLLGDFDEDGVPDYVYRADPFLITARGDGNGGFVPTDVSPAFGNLVAAADFDSDGHLDLLVTDGFGGMDILRGHGDGTFEAPHPDAHIDDANVFSPVIADVNNDGVPDIVNGYPILSVRLGIGEGFFSAPLVADNDDFAYDIAVGDLDGDGRLDILAKEIDGLFLFRGNGDGTFLEDRKLFEPLGQAVVADINGDGIADVAGVTTVRVSDFTSQAAIRYFLGTGNGAFGAAQTLLLPGDDQVITLFRLADADGDGSPDFIVSKEKRIRVYPNHGDGTFDVARILVAEGDFALKDLNGDGHPDLVLAANSVAVFLGTGGGSFAQATRRGITPIYTTFNFTPAVTGDFDGDGHPDVLVLSSGDFFQNPGSVTLFLGDGAGHLNPGPAFASGARPDLAVVADVDHDGKDDLIIEEIRDGQYGMSIYRSTGGGQFAAPFRILGLFPPVVVADFDHDGKTDLAGSPDGMIAVFAGNGDGTFQNARSTSIPIGQNLAVGDFNHDGFPDLVNAAPIGSTVLLGDGSGGFTPSAALAGTGDGPLLSVADFDGDGNPDIVVRGGVSDAILYRGDGKGGFDEGAEIPFSSSASAILAADMTGDGLPDIVTLSDSVSVFASRGNGSFATPASFVASGRSPMIGDFNGDGRPDIVLFDDTAFSFLFNTRCVPKHLKIVQQPSSCDAAGTPFTVAPAVAVADDGGNRISCGSVTVTASLLARAGGGGPLQGTTTMVTSGGGVTFDNLSLSPVASGTHLVSWPGGRLHFSSPGIASVGTRSITDGLSVSLPPSIPGCSSASSFFDLPTNLDRYEWTYDGAVVSRSPVLTIETSSVGSHSVSVTISKDGCVASSVSTLTIDPTPPPPSISAPPEAAAGQTALTAMVPNPGEYFWSIQNGTMTSGQGSDHLIFNANAGGQVMTISVTSLNETCASQPGRVQIPVDFLDVPPSNPFHDFVAALEKAGVTDGCGSGNYCPTHTLRRDQMAAMITRATIGQAPVSGSLGGLGTQYDCDAHGFTVFTDVSPTYPFCASIHHIAALGITTGCAPERFCPAGLVTRQQMALFIGRAIAPGATPPSSYSDGTTGRSYDCSTTSPFTDVAANTEVCNAVGYLWAKGVVDGFGDGTFHPLGLLTRAPAAKFIAKGFGLTLGP